MATSFLHSSISSTFKTKIQISSSSSSYKPMKITMMSQTHTSWASINSEVEAHIQHALSVQKPSMAHLVSEVPRSMAPALCIAACEAVGGNKEQAIPAASALHLMHIATYQLSSNPNPKPKGHHDDIVQFGYQLLASMDDPAHDNSDRIVRVTIEMARAMGSEGPVNGQYLKMRCLGLDPNEPCEEGTTTTIDLAFEKTGGALYSCGAACGAILGGGTDEEIDKLKRYGLYVGMIKNIMGHDGLGRERRFLKLADSLRSLALKELEGLQNRNVEHLCSIMNGFSAFLKAQKNQFPQG